jgi:hypothetical protein
MALAAVSCWEPDPESAHDTLRRELQPGGDRLCGAPDQLKAI